MPDLLFCTHSATQYFLMQAAAVPPEGPPPPPPPPLDHSLGRISIIEGDIFYSPNCPSPAVLPDAPISNSYIFRETSVRLHMFHTPRWWTQPYGWLAFLPLRPSFSGYPFDRLNIFPAIEQVGPSLYRLHDDIISRWKRLENKLVWATAFIGQRHPAVCLRPPPPSAFGYIRSYRSPRAARAQAHASRDWFAMWMGLLSYHIASAYDSKHTLPGIPTWVELLAELGFPQSWMSGVLASSVSTFSTRVARVGLFLDPLDPPPMYGAAPPSVHWLCDHHVPVWYPWTSRHVEAARHKLYVARLAPPPELFQTSTTFLTKSPSSALSNPPASWSAIPSSHIPDLSAPIDPGPSQLPAIVSAIADSGWQQFFERRAQRQAEKMKKETPAQRSVRLQREQNPPTTNAVVFQWVESEEDPDIRIRERVSKRSNRDILEYYVHHRRYDAFENEWDVCSEFSTTDTEEAEENAEMFEDYIHPEQSEVVPEDGEILEEGFPLAVKIPDNAAEVYTDANPLDRAPSPVNDEPMEVRADQTPSSNPLQILIQHYGFTPPLSDISDIPNLTSRWTSAQKAIGLVGEVVESMSPIEKGMLHFIRSLIMGRAGSEDWDLDDNNRNALAHRVQPHFITATLNDCSRRPRHIFLPSLPLSPACPWQLGLFSATNVLYAFRLMADHAENVYGISHLLIRQGIPFRTLRLRRNAPSSAPRSSFVRFIPIRLSGYVFTQHDYDAYIQERRAILSQPRARAALLQGGIVWRLAQEHLSFDAALDGPSSTVMVHGVGELFCDNTHHEYWDDGLPEHDSSLISGQYQCFTGVYLDIFIVCNVLT
jgi:hypothetical protein